MLVPEWPHRPSTAGPRPAGQPDSQRSCTGDGPQRSLPRMDTPATTWAKRGSQGTPSGKGRNSPLWGTHSCKMLALRLPPESLQVQNNISILQMVKLRLGAVKLLPQVHLVRKRVSTGFAPQACAASNTSCLPSQEKGKQGPEPGDPCSQCPGVRVLALPVSLREEWDWNALHPDESGSSGHWPSSSTL